MKHEEATQKTIKMLDELIEIKKSLRRYTLSQKGYSKNWPIMTVDELIHQNEFYYERNQELEYKLKAITKIINGTK